MSLFLLLAVLKLSAETSAVDGLCKRLLGERASDFTFVQLTQDPDKKGMDRFLIDAEGGKVTIKGSNKIAMASGLHWYLKHHCHCHVSWNGDQLNLPVKLPNAKVEKSSPYKHGFYFNYCTFSYTMAWWDWERWQREIDYMALCGIDMPLAITGSEALWINFLKRFGYSHEEAKAYVCGPAYNAWWLMGNLEGRGGPVTDEWIETRVELQKKILGRMRELDMRPVMPGFVGLVPNNLPEIHQGAKILPQGKWAGPNLRPAVLDPNTPLFDQMAKAWYEEQEKLYGHCDAFAGDLFHEGGKTHGLDVGKIAAKVQKHMIDHDANAIWTIQGWGHNPTEGLLSSLKKENTLVLELCNEFWRNWEKKKGFWDTPWTFSTIIMYGGNTAMHGRIDNIATNLRAALDSKTPPSALGATWESIEINPVIMDYLWDMRWRKEVPEPSEWLQGYAKRRYGKQDPKLEQAWAKLQKTGYGSHASLRRPQESIFCARPGLKVTKASPFAATVNVHYDHREMRDAAKLLLTASADCGKNPAYRYDLVDTTRQFLTNSGLIAYRKMIDAYQRKDKEAFQKFSTDFLTMLEDQDKLLGTQKEFLLGIWLKSARDIAPNEEQRIQNEHAARLLITTWTEEKTMLDNYAWREWNGILGKYYLPQWKTFIRQLSSELNGEKIKFPDPYIFRQKWAAQTWETDSYPSTPQGDSIAEVTRILNKWSPWLDANYSPPVTGKRQDFIGSWEYKAQGATWRRTLHPDGKLTLTRDGKPWKAWSGFTWKYQDNKATLHRKGGKQFSSMTLQETSKAKFSEGFVSTRIETGSNNEADEIAE